MTSYRTRSFFAIVLLSVALQLTAMGQSGSGMRTGTLRPTMPGSNRPTRAVTISGNVITDDGSPLPERVAIERVCNGRVTPEGRTDFKGYFSIDVGQHLSSPVGDLSRSGEGTAETSGEGMSLMDLLKARTSQNTSPVQSVLWGCELRGSLAGYRSSNRLIPEDQLRGGFGAVQVGTIVLQKIDKVQGATVSATSLNAPKDARKAYTRGHHTIESNKLPEAQHALETAVQLYPQYAAAWQDLGWVYLQQNQLDKAREAFTHARTADVMFVPAYVGLASLAVRESKWQDAAEMSARATQLDGVDFPAAFFYNSLANFRLGNLDQAGKSARMAEMLGAQSSFPQVSLLLGMVLVNRGDYADAAEQFRSYLKAAPNSSNADAVRRQLANLESAGTAESKAQAAPAK